MIEQTLQREMSCRPSRLVHRGRFGEPVDGTELEQLGTGLEVTGPTWGQGLENGDFKFNGHEPECKTGV
jgi:hypothetical protein